VPEIEDLARAAAVLEELGATKSLYGADPDGNEFEIMWVVPREQWGEYERHAVVRPLDMRREIERYGPPASGLTGLTQPNARC
jgi:catechol-2,3-dioxygenase